MKQYKFHIFVVIITIIFQSSTLRSQAPYDWKEMANVGVYNFKSETFWNNYQNQQDTIKANIIRGRKLGFNMVRIPLNYVEPNIRPADDLNPPFYKHGWPDSTYIGTGRVFQGNWSSSQYLTDIDDLINFCNTNGIKVHLLLFNYHGRNWPEVTTSYYTNDDNGHVKWFIDGCAWIDTILTRTENKVEVCELWNEVTPSNELLSGSLRYPTYVLNRFLLEMSNYLHYRHPSVKQMISITPALAYDTSWLCLKNMLTRVEAHQYTRLPTISPYIDSLYSHGNLTLPQYYAMKNNAYETNCYFDYLSIHDYNWSGGFKYVLDKVLAQGPFQNIHSYKWFIGEMGFDLDIDSMYETDQAKFYQNAFQIMSEEFPNPGSNFKGAGIWVPFDYSNVAMDNGTPLHMGIISPDNQLLVKKRKAAYVVENALEGYVDNPGFEIGPGTDSLFDDSPWCNGWTAYYPTCCQQYHNEDYTYTTATGHGGVLQLNPASTRQIGWSSLPGGMIRVKPTTNITVGAQVSVSGTPCSANIFVSLAWFDTNRTWISSTPVPSAKFFNSSSWTAISFTYTVPQSAYFAAPYLMKYNSSSTVQFDNVTYTPDWAPIISFTFDDDIGYFPSSDNKPSALGWDAATATTTRQNGELDFSPGAIVKSTHYVGNYATAIRTKSGKEYSAVADISSQQATVWEITMAANDKGYPTTEVTIVPTTVTTGQQWAIWSFPTIPYDGNPWFKLQIGDAGFGNTKVKEIAVFEHTYTGLPPGISVNLGLRSRILANYPNPFNPSTSIKYLIAQSGRVKIAVYDVLGRKVITLVDEQENPGEKSISFNGSQLTSGIYFIRMSIGNVNDVKKVMLLK